MTYLTNMTGRRFSRGIAGAGFPRFRDADAERAFWKAHDTQMFVVRACFLVLSLIIYLSLAVLDLHLGKDAAFAMLGVRAVTGMAMLAGIVIFVTPGRTPQARNRAIELCAFASGGGQILFILLAPGEATGHYQFGLGVILSVGTLILTPRFATVLRVLALTMTVYAVTIPWHQDDLVSGMVSTLFNFLIAFAALIGSFERERLDRLQAVTGQALARSNTELAESRCEALMARDEAMAANKAKSRFLASVSHELRTPMNAILGFSEVMRAEMFGAVGSAKYAQYIEHIHASGLLLQANIDDLLDLARLEAGKIGWTDEIFALDRILDGTLATCGRMAREAEVTLTMVNDARALMIEADLFRLTQAAINLVTNALKFTDPGGSVTVHARRAGDGTCLIRVTDTGCGISPENLESMRLPFAQAHENSYSKEKGGLGLGLAIVSGIVATLGGRLDLDSTEGQGTVATLVIPPDRIVEAADAA